ncbi:hypothetical protein N9D37_01015 [Erythrobacter sp.]|nr:hypothetical protein [Erythrobacter sp.]
MLSASSDNFTEHLAAVEPEIAAAMARYRESFPYSPAIDDDGKPIDPDLDDKAHLYLLLQETFLGDVRSVTEWMVYCTAYPSIALPESQLALPDSPDVKVRAHYLRTALPRLLTLLGAPEPMIDDVQSILGLHKPRAANVRGAAQAELNNDPTASARAVASRLRKRKNKNGEVRSADHGQISKDLKTGLLVRPANFAWAKEER